MEHKSLQSQSFSPEDTTIIRDLINIQQNDLEIKKLEASNRRAEIESNERIAMASIEAQSNCDISHSKTFKYAYLISQLKIIAIAIVVAVVLCFAIVYGYSDLAIEIAKYVFFAVSGYFAGLGHGKILQSKNKKLQNDDE